MEETSQHLEIGATDHAHISRRRALDDDWYTEDEFASWYGPHYLPCWDHAYRTHQSTQSSPPNAIEHGWNATIIEDVLEHIIPFMTMERPGHTMCDPKPGCTPVLITGEHVHIWCYTCANSSVSRHCAASFNACQDCRILRTLLQLSRRWSFFMWEQFPQQDA